MSRNTPVPVRWRQPAAAAAARRHRRAFSLIELMVVLVLIAMFAAAAEPVLQWSLRTLVTPPPAARAARLDAALASLRRDVWQATALSAPSPHALSVTSADGHATTWHVGPGDRLQRDDHQWPGLIPDATVAVDGATVHLTLPDGHGFRGGTITVQSQAMLLGSGS